MPGATPGVFQNAETDTPGALALDQRQRPEPQQQRDAHRRGHQRQHLAAPPQRLRVAGRDDRHRQHLDQQLRRRAGDGRRRGHHRHHQVGHEPVQGVGVRVLQQRQAERDAVLLRQPIRRQAGQAADHAATSTAARSADRSCGTGCSSSDRSRATSRISGASTSSACRMPRYARAISATRETRTDRCRSSTIRRPATPTAAAGRRSLETSFPPDRLNPIALKLLGLYPDCRTRGGTGAGNLTNNYSREESTHDRSRQLRRQGQLQPHLDAPDLGQVQHARRGRGRPDLLPRPRSELGPGRRVHQGVHGHRRPDLDARTDARVGHDRRLLAAGSEVVWRGLLHRQLSASTRWASRAPTIRGPATSGMPGYPQFATGFSTLGNNDGWTPVWRDERVTLDRHERDEGQGPPRPACRLLDELPVPQSLAAGTRQPARPLRVLAGNTTALRGTGAQTANFYNTYASFLLGPGQQRAQERPERAADRPRMAARPVRPRPVAGLSTN